MKPIANWCTVIALVGVGSLLAAGCGSAKRSAPQTTSATVVTPVPKAATTGPFRPLRSFAVFRRDRVATDVMPRTLVEAASLAAGTPPNHLGSPDIRRSRLLIRAAALYAWPIAESGICIGIPKVAVDCRPGFPKAQPALPFAVVAGSSSPSPLAIGIVDDDVTSAQIQLASGKRCKARVQNNAFLCVLSRPTGADSVQSLTVFAKGKATTIRF